MSTLQERIEDYIGTVSDTTSLQNWLDAGIEFVIDVSKPDKLEKLVRDVTVADAGLAVVGLKILGAHKSDVPARKIPYTFKSKALDSTSIYYASATDPAFCVGNGKIFVIPGGGSAITVTHPTVTASSTSISLFEENQTQGVILYSAIQAANQKLQGFVSTSDSLSITLPTVPTSPTLTTITTGTTSFTPISVSDAITSNGTYTDITDTADLIAPTISASLVGTLSDKPTYTKIATSFSFTDADARLANDDTELAEAELARMQTQINSTNQTVQEELNEFSKDSIVFQAEVQKAVHNSNHNLQVAVEQAKVNLETDIQNLRKDLETKITNARNTLELELFNTGKDVEVELANLRKDLEVDVQNKIKALESDFFDVKNAIDVAIANNEQILKQYTAEIQAYTYTAVAKIQEYQGKIENKNLVVQSIVALIASLREELKLIIGTL